MAKAGARVKVTLRCAECKQRNYNTVKNKKNTTEKLEMSKYCPFCRKHTKLERSSIKWLRTKRKSALLP